MTVNFNQWAVVSIAQQYKDRDEMRGPKCEISMGVTLYCPTINTIYSTLEDAELDDLLSIAAEER